ncbi:MAG: hypothetical protein LLG09_06825 [Negativicutes bacterium]|nr:hypothetical protein [Negativicutes bacterium]
MRTDCFFLLASKLENRRVRLPHRLFFRFLSFFFLPLFIILLNKENDALIDDACYGFGLTDLQKQALFGLICPLLPKADRSGNHYALLPNSFSLCVFKQCRQISF